MAAKKEQGWFSALLESVHGLLCFFRVVCVLPLPMLYGSNSVFVCSIVLTTKVCVCVYVNRQAQYL